MTLDLRKPAPGSGKRERFERRVKNRAAERRLLRAAQLDAAKDERMRREACYVRDKGCCRACGRVLFLIGGPPATLAHCHHIVYRSAGGSDDLLNRVTLCQEDHEAEHYSLLVIAGDPNDVLTFTRKDKKGLTIRAWESKA